MKVSDVATLMVVIGRDVADMRLDEGDQCHGTRCGLAVLESNNVT
jgi:hypothetical protein